MHDSRLPGLLAVLVAAGLGSACSESGPTLDLSFGIAVDEGGTGKSLRYMGAVATVQGNAMQPGTYNVAVHTVNKTGSQLMGTVQIMGPVNDTFNFTTGWPSGAPSIGNGPAAYLANHVLGNPQRVEFTVVCTEFSCTPSPLLVQATFLELDGSNQDFYVQAQALVDQFAANWTATSTANCSMEHTATVTSSVDLSRVHLYVDTTTPSGSGVFEIYGSGGSYMGTDISSYLNTMGAAEFDLHIAYLSPAGTCSSWEFDQYLTSGDTTGCDVLWSSYVATLDNYQLYCGGP